MTIQWDLFVLVVATALVASVVVVALFSAGIRLFATPRPGTAPGSGPRDEEFDDVPRGRRPAGVTAAGVLLFALAGAAALGGVLLILVR